MKKLLAPVAFRSLCAVVLSSAGLAQGGWSRPLNVLFIMNDQHNAHVLGHTDNGFGGVQASVSPNLDALAAQGTRFDAAFCVTPQCSPSRFTMITGRWPHDSGLRWNKIWEPQGLWTFPRAARDAGYVTATIGKHHFHWLNQSLPLSEDLGFDLIVDYGDYAAYCQSHGTGTYSDPGRAWRMAGLFNNRGGGIALPPVGFTFNTNELHPSGYWADRVIEFLEQRAGSAGDGRPFVLYYSMLGPHPPILPTGPAEPEDWAHAFHPFDSLALAPNHDKVSTMTRLSYFQAQYEGISTERHQEALSYYYGLVNQIDWNIGRVLARLETLGLADETIVVFTADHGEMATEMGCWIKGAGSYDALTRVPLILRLPGAVEAGLVSDALVSTIDLAPTLLDLTGVPALDVDRAALGGESLAPILLGAGTPAGWRDTVFVEQGDPHSTNFLRARSARTRAGKYTFDEMGGGEEEYYDLVLDEWELENLIAEPSRQAEIAALRAVLDGWWNGEQGHAPYYTVTGEGGVSPSPASSPDPPIGATNVPRDVDPAWIPSTGADAIEVWLGTSPSALALVATLPAMSASFNPGTLEPACGYYWRVDGVNDNGVTLGPVWSFRTTAGGADGPALASAPDPAWGEEAVPLAPTLSWTSGADTLTHDLYFGPAGALALVAGSLPAATTSFAPGALQAGVTYEWRLDANHATGSTAGTVWSFTTDASALPRPAAPLGPPHLARVPHAMPFSLEFLPGAAATSHDVYFGTGHPLPFLGNQASTTIQLPGLVAGRTYYWRVDEVNARGTRRGFTWRFTLE